MHVLTVMQESLRRYSVVPVVVRELGRDDVLCGHKVPRGSHVVTALKAVHQQWKDPLLWQPERFMPGGEFDQFSEDMRQYMVRSLGTWVFHTPCTLLLWQYHQRAHSASSSLCHLTGGGTCKVAKYPRGFFPPCLCWLSASIWPLFASGS